MALTLRSVKGAPLEWEEADANFTYLLGRTRLILTADATFYVATSGNDTTGDGSSGAPWATIQGALDKIWRTIDGGGYNVTIQVADGTYAVDLVTRRLVGVTRLTISGNAPNTSAVVIGSGTPGTTAFRHDTEGDYRLLNLKLAGVAAVIHRGAYLICENQPSSATGFLCWNALYGRLMLTGTTAVSGASVGSVLSASYSGVLIVSSATITVSPALTVTQFASATLMGLISVASTTISGTVTGKRYTVSGSSAVQAPSGGSTTFFPGSTAGTVSSDSYYGA